MQRFKNPAMQRALKALNSNTYTSFQERLYGGAWGIALLFPIFRYVEPPKFGIKIFIILIVVALPPLITEFTYQPFRRVILRLFKLKRD